MNYSAVNVRDFDIRGFRFGLLSSIGTAGCGSFVVHCRGDDGEALGENFITADQRERVRGVLNDALQGKDTANFEVPLVTNDGKRFDVPLNATSRRDAAGNVIGMVGVGQNMAELRAALVSIGQLSRPFRGVDQSP